jgi:hypothetical protein
MPTSCSNSIATFFASALFILAFTRSGSSICLPIFITGLSDVIGSWKTMETFEPQMSRSLSSPAPTISKPSSTAEPETETFVRG